MKTILVIIDMQEDFIRGPLGNDDCRNAIAGCVDLCKSGEFDKILFSRDTHNENYMKTLEGQKLPVPHCIEGSAGWEIIPELKEYVESEAGFVFNKTTFGSTNLPLYLSTYVHGNVSELELHFAGVCTSICVLSNMMLCRAEFPNAKIVLHKNATGDVTKEMKEAAFICAKSIQCDVED